MTVHIDGQPDTYVGATLATYEKNGYDDSDFYAICWNGERLVTEEYATTRFVSQGCYAKVDSTAEVDEQVRAYLTQCEVRSRYSHAFYQAFRPDKGRKVIVVKGRKLKIGTEGVVVDKMVSNYSHNNRYNSSPIRHEEDQVVRLRLESGELTWVAEANVRVTDYDDYLPDWQEIEATVRKECAQANVRNLAYQKGHYLSFDWDHNEFWVKTNNVLPLDAMQEVS